MQRVVPAILTKDQKELQMQLQALKDQSRWVHIDIMDGKFVPAVSINLAELKEANQFFNLEIHLMVQEPEKYLEDCNAVGAKRVYFHLKGAKDPKAVLLRMEQYPFQRGIAINPEMPVEEFLPFAETAEAVLFMSIVPGAQGNEFIPTVLSKVQDVRSRTSDILIGMDGGIEKDNIKQVFGAKVDYVAVGSGIWKTKDPIASLKELQEMVS